MPETEIEIAQKSLSFLKTYPVYDAVVYPISDLPYPKDTIKESLSKFAMSPVISQEDRGFVAKFYILLANFIEDANEIRLVSMMNEKIADAPHVPASDTKDIAKWFESIKDTDDFKRYTTIMNRIDAERKKLRIELEAMNLKFITSIS